MNKDQEAQSITGSISMNKMRGKMNNWLHTYAKMNKSDKSARIIQYYKPMPNLIIQALKKEEVVLESDDGL